METSRARNGSLNLFKKFVIDSSLINSFFLAFREDWTACKEALQTPCPLEAPACLRPWRGRSCCLWGPWSAPGPASGPRWSRARSRCPPEEWRRKKGFQGMATSLEPSYHPFLTLHKNNSITSVYNGRQILLNSYEKGELSEIVLIHVFAFITNSKRKRMHNI